MEYRCFPFSVFTQTQIHLQEMRCEMIPVRVLPEAPCFGAPPFPYPPPLKTGCLFSCRDHCFRPVLFWCLIIPDSVTPPDSRSSTAGDGDRAATRFESEAKVNLVGSSGLHSQNENQNPTYIRVGALLQTQSWKPIKRTLTLCLCGSFDGGFYSIQPSVGSRGAFYFSLSGISLGGKKLQIVSTSIKGRKCIFCKDDSSEAAGVSTHAQRRSFGRPPGDMEAKEVLRRSVSERVQGETGPPQTGGQRQRARALSFRPLRLTRPLKLG